MTAAGLLLGLALSASADATVPAPTGAAASILSDIRELLGPAPAAKAQAPLPVFPESLVFEVSWGVLGVGEATLAVDGPVGFAGRPAYRIVSTAVSNRFCDAFYKVRDLNEAWLDAETLSSLGYSKKLREGHFFRDEWVVFDPARRTWFSKTTRKDDSFTHQAGTTPVTVQDILSSLYFVRTKALEPGGQVVVDVNTKQNWPLVVRVVKRETVSTPAGKFKTLLLEPALRQEGLFIQKGRRLRLWVTDDERKTPVLMKVEVFFGHITARLAKML